MTFENPMYIAYIAIITGKLGGIMVFLSSFKLSEEEIKNPNIYPYNVFHRKSVVPFVFAPITIFYGSNGSGKSTILNIMANKLELKGREYATSNSFGTVDYCYKFSEECAYSIGDDEDGYPIKGLPANSRYIKSEDILYEIKKVQQRQILGDGMKYDLIKKGLTKKQATQFLLSKEGQQQQGFIEFTQEKYSNGETSLQYLEGFLIPDALYLLDEPEVSLSPQNQVKLAQEINHMTRFLNCQFVIATHSPFMLGTLNAKIYNLDMVDYDVQEWYELENVKYFYDFFKKYEKEFR